MPLMKKGFSHSVVPLVPLVKNTTKLGQKCLKMVLKIVASQVVSEIHISQLLMDLSLVSIELVSSKFSSILSVAMIPRGMCNKLYIISDFICFVSSLCATYKRCYNCVLPFIFTYGYYILLYIFSYLIRC